MGSGSILTSYVARLGAIVGPGVSIRDLQRDRAALLDLNRWFRDRVEGLGIKVLSFYETRPLKIGFLSTVVVVEASSADPGIRGVQPIALDDDHVSAAKPASPSALQVLRTQRFIETVFELEPHLAKLRRQAAAVCYRIRDDGEIEFLLVRTDGGRWTFPKGDIETSRGESPAHAAAREAAEEAGVRGELAAKPLHTYLHLKKLKQKKSQLAPGASEQLAVTAYLLRVTRQAPPDETGRPPEWFASADAVARLREDRGLQYADEVTRVVEKACCAASLAWRDAPPF